MTTENKNAASVPARPYDVSMIRPPLRIDEFRIRGHSMSRPRLRRIRRALRVLHGLETMGVNVYKLQITRRMCEHNRELIAAMCNEMTHVQDYLVKLFEYSSRPGRMRWVGWLTGAVVGRVSRLLGRDAILRTGIWVEKRMIRRYDRLLKQVDWEEDARRVIEKNLADEHGHIKRWRDLLRTTEPDY